MDIIKFSEIYTQKIHNFTDALTKSKIFNNLSTPKKPRTKLLYKLENASRKFAMARANKNIAFSKFVYDFLTSEGVYKVARWTTIPFSWLWLKFLKSRTKKILPVFEEGTHLVFALQGGGKSSGAYEFIEELRLRTGLGSYVNVLMEKPRYDPVGKYYYRFHKVFKEEDFWGLKHTGEYSDKGDPIYTSTQRMQFDPRFRNVVIDELLSTFNHRNNKSGQYNEVFIGMMKGIAHQRHQGIDRFYFCSQIDTTDIQLMSIFKYTHAIKVHLDVTYPEWLKSGKLSRHIQGWWINSSHRETNKRGKEIIRSKRYYLKRTFIEKYFETKNMSHEYKKLQKDRIEVIKGASYD